MLVATDAKTVPLKDGRIVAIRALEADDSSMLREFLLSLQDRDRLFLRHDVRDPDLLRRWAEEMRAERMVGRIAVDNARIVGFGRLYRMTHNWMSHVGHIRLITAPTHRRVGLGGLLIRELVDVAAQLDIEKLQAHVMEEDVGAAKMFAAIGFRTEAVLHGLVKDWLGHKHNLAIMVSDVSSLSSKIEDWIQDAMIPAFRVPGGGC